VAQSFQLKEGDEITLEACARGDSYQWQPLTAITLHEDTLLGAQPDEATVYTAAVTTANGCRADCVYEVKVLNGLLVPTGFSPNGDGVNDLFRILNTNIKLNNLSIYNRWGNLVFSTANITEGWDGTYQNTEQELACTPGQPHLHHHQNRQTKIGQRECDVGAVGDKNMRTKFFIFS
jgi:gliding motility-associated-like protein